MRKQGTATQLIVDGKPFLALTGELRNNVEPPSGTVYNPDKSGTLASLGVHEHWNNATDKKYSRNLGRKEGIELVASL